MKEEGFAGHGPAYGEGPGSEVEMEAGTGAARDCSPGRSVGTANERHAKLDAALRSRDNGSKRGAANDAGRPPRGRSSRLRVDPVELSANRLAPLSGPVDVGAPGYESVQAEHAEDPAALTSRLRRLSRAGDLTRSELVEALVGFDELELWRASGLRSCVAWQIVELGASRSLAYENLKVGRALQNLPVIAGLFRTGELSFSKVRALVNVAIPEDETALAIMALDSDADTVLRRCDEHRWGREAASEADDGEREHARFERRSFTHSRLPDGSSASRLVLPPDTAELVAAAVEDRVERRIREARAAGGFEALPSFAQMRADALVEIVQASLMKNPDAPGAPVTDLVVAVVDAEALETSQAEVAARGPDDETPLPLPLRASIEGILGGSISPSTARRMACAGTLVMAILEGGEPVAMGRRIRFHNPAQRKALIVRDGAVCAFPGCGRRTNLDPHHIVDWAWGGSTDVRDTVSLCRSGCHQKVHDEGWIITRIEDDEPVERHASAAALLEGADERTQALVAKLDERRPRYRFELPRGATSGPSVERWTESGPEPAAPCCGNTGAGVHTEDAKSTDATPHEHPGDEEDLGPGERCRDVRGIYAVERVPATAPTHEARCTHPRPPRGAVVSVAGHADWLASTRTHYIIRPDADVAVERMSGYDDTSDFIPSDRVGHIGRTPDALICRISRTSCGRTSNCSAPDPHRSRPAR